MGVKRFLALVGVSLAGAAVLWWAFADGSPSAPSSAAASETSRGAAALGAAPPPHIDPPAQPRLDLLARGLVVDEDGAPVADAEIWAYGDKLTYASSRRITASASDGTFEVRGVADLVWIGARAAGRSPSVFRRLSPSDRPPAAVRLILRGAGGDVEGRVLDPDQNPVAGATVVIGVGSADPSAPEYAIVTDDAGHFGARGIAAGSLVVVARAARLDWSPWRGSIEVREASSTHLEITLARSIEMHGTITTSDGTAARDVKVEVFFREALEDLVSRTDARGAYRISGITPGLVSARAESPDGLRARKNFDAASGAPIEWDPILASEPAIVGRIVDARGAPLEGWTVRAAQSGNSARMELFSDIAIARTDAEGRFTIRHCRDEVYRLKVDPSEEWRSATSLVVEGIRPSPTEVVVIAVVNERPTARIAGRIVDPNDQPVAEGEIHVHSTGEPAVNLLLHPDEAGHFETAPLVAGSYLVSVRVSGFPPIALAARRLDDGERCDLGDLRLQQPGFVVVTIDDHLIPEGGPTPVSEESLSRLAAIGYVTDEDAAQPRRYPPRLKILDPSGNAVGTPTVDGGRARSSPLAPGAYVLDVVGVGIAPATYAFEIAAGRETHVDVELQPGLKRTLRISLSPNAPASPSMRWTIRDDSNHLLARRGPAGSPGPWSETMWLAPGRYRYEAFAENGARAQGEFTVDRAGAEEIAIEIALK